MRTSLRKFSQSLTCVVSVVTLFIISIPAYAVIQGITGAAGSPVFNLAADEGFIYTPDGDSVLTWGYAANGGTMQYPGPTLIVNQGDVVTINLTNKLNDYKSTLGKTLGIKTSLLLPGQSGVTATGTAGTSAGVIALETGAATETVTYKFTASNPGTYTYQSGTNQDLQIEMGLVGTIIVRPTTSPATQAYNTTDTAYDYEYLFVLTEMDPSVHYAVELANTPADLAAIDNTTHHTVLWFINGRNGPDTVAPKNAPYLPHQPYDSLAQVHPGDVALIRYVNAGRDMHPFHTHGNHFKILARDGRLLQTTGATTADLARSDYTLQTVPGATYDTLWSWTGEKMGWDIFGDVNIDPLSAHTCTPAAGTNFDATTREYCPDHGKPFPVTLTNQNELTFGGFYSGSPFLGAFANLPPGEGGLNLNGGMFYMWHSHNEREIVNNNIFPGGMLTMMVVEPVGVTIAK